MHRPCVAALLGDAEAAGIEVGDDLVDGFADFRRRATGFQVSAALPRLVDDGLQFVHGRIVTRCQRDSTKARMRRADSTHSSTLDTSAMRTRFVPGLTPPDSRAR